MNNDLVIPALQIGGTMLANDIILGSSGITKFISDYTGTYIYNNLSVSGNINNVTLTNVLNAKATTAQLSELK
jgi:hypothetical protein